MISTKSKDKLWGELAYPIGAQTISEALSILPFHELIELRFYPGKWSKVPTERALAGGLATRILAARYQPVQKPGISGDNRMFENGWYDEKWSINVYPVLRTLRSVTTGLLKEFGLPKIVKWMEEYQQEGWRTRSHDLELVFDPNEMSLIAKRSDGV